MPFFSAFFKLHVRITYLLTYNQFLLVWENFSQRCGGPLNIFLQIYTFLPFFNYQYVHMQETTISQKIPPLPAYIWETLRTLSLWHWNLYTKASAATRPFDLQAKSILLRENITKSFQHAKRPYKAFNIILRPHNKVSTNIKQFVTL